MVSDSGHMVGGTPQRWKEWVDMLGKERLSMVGKVRGGEDLEERI